MRLTSSGTLVLSASDLGKFLVCAHLTALDLAVAKGLRKPPPVYDDPVLELLRQRGFEHEEAFVDAHREKGLNIVDLSEGEDRAARTIEAMRAGADMIVQGKLQEGSWGGYPDILQRVARGSGLGEWSYEVVDTKLARETKGTTILQLSLYSEILANIQKIAPEFFYVVTPLGTETYRVNDYVAYYRLVKHGLASVVVDDPLALLGAHYPEPVDYCEMCRWEQTCKEKRRADDHLSLVAGITRLQRHELEPRGIVTLTGLANATFPLDPKLERGSEESYLRAHNQARVQLRGRNENAPVHEMLPVEKGQGLCRLPEPSPGDIFLDLEGDAFARDGGREYLFGLVRIGEDGKEQYEQHWAVDDEQECAAFETVMDGIMAAWAADPGMHIYHYHHYEPSAFKRLMGRYATREADMDRLLRAERFVDLRLVVKQGLLASVEKYSIKDLEPFYGYDRKMNLRVAGDHRAALERLLQTSAADKITQEDRDIVAAYNEDDCVSTRRLRDWLETLRGSLVREGVEVPRPAEKEDAASEKRKARELRVAELVAELTAGVPVDVDARSEEQQARWLLANMLEFHRREDKVDWWEFFALRDLEEAEREDAVDVIMGLALVERVRKVNTRVVDRYRFPVQRCRVREGDGVQDADGNFGEVVSIDRKAGSIDILKPVKRTDDHPVSIFAHTYINPAPRPEALDRVAESVIADGLAGTGYRAARALLMRERPRLREHAFVKAGGETATDFAVRVVPYLDGTVLPIQGPPGSGKTYTGARMICELVRRGMRVGVTANSHKVVDNLLMKVLDLAAEEKVAVRCGHLHKRGTVPEGVAHYTDNEPAFDALRSREIHVLGGTSWLWADEEAAAIADVLFVDEAGQMALANVMACAGAADSMVLLGDPQQLDQPSRGSHPDGTEVSALAHILGDDRVIAPERGIFLPETWRMHPSICKFCSDVFYESKLTARAGLENQKLAGTGRFDGAGLWVVPVTHEGNTNDSQEEVDAVLAIVQGLLGGKGTWVDKRGASSPITASDILVVSPYNLQVMALDDVLGPLGVQAGTVDKFQGREAPVVIYSMAASSPSDASRGMEFLYSLSRLNVATSRARCATILVASPLLFEPECKSPRQMKLANGLCSYVEMARVVTHP